MEYFITELSSFFRWLLVSTMQVSVVVCLILAVEKVIRNRLAVRWHYWLWLVLLARMVMPLAPESNFSVFTLVSQARSAIVSEQGAKVTRNLEIVDAKPEATEHAAQKTTATNLQQHHEPVEPVKRTPQLVQSLVSLFSLGVVETLSVIWLAVALGLGLFALGCNFKLWRIIKSQRPLTEGNILDLFEDCKAEMGIQTILGVIVSDRVKSPALFGVVRPRLLLPEGIIETLSLEELRYVFLHELGHVKRHDIYLGWLMVILQALHWFNPLVWLAFHRMRADRELACDGLVLSTLGTDESQAYGQTLVNLFRGFSKIQYSAGVAGILENNTQLKRRIKMIAQFEKGSYRWSILAVVLLAVLGGVVLTNAEEEKEFFDINATVAQLDIDNATLDDVIYIFGEPLKYAWNRKTIPRDEIPTDHYCMVYPEFSILMRQDSIGELRFESPEAGYVFHDAIRVGSSLDEVLAFLGEPTETVTGEPIGWINDVLYMDVDGEEGYCYYQRADWNVRMFFGNYKVAALYVTSSSSSSDEKEKLREEDLPSTSFINEEGHIVDKVDYPFVNDPEAIGCWESVDYVSDIEDFDPNRRSHRGELLEELFILENGRTNLAFSWTKGLFLHLGDKTASAYVIEEIDGTTYMFFEWKGGNYRTYHIKPKFYVLKKVPGKVYVETRTYDKVDYPFVDDPEAIGTWEAIDFVEEPEQFKPEQRQWQGGELFLKELVIEPNGEMSEISGERGYAIIRAWRKKVGESLLKELGVDPNGTMGQIMDKTVAEFTKAWAKVIGESFADQLVVDPDAKISEILKAQASDVDSAWNKVFGESSLKEFINPNTKISEIMNREGPKAKRVWTKGLIIIPAGRIASRYQIKEIEDSTYMFYEWKRGDYVLRQMKPKYYVLKKK